MFSNILKAYSSKNQSRSINRVVGIDMGSSAIKIVELEDRSGIVTLVNYGELQTGPYADRKVGESVSLSVDAEKKALLEINQAAIVKATSAVFAMPLSSSFVTVLTLPIESEADDVSSRVRVEARKYIPLPMNKVTLDWLDLGVVPHDDSEDVQKKEVLVAAIQNSALEQSKSLLQMVGFNNVPTEIECFSAVRGAYKENQDYSVIIDIGAVFSKLYILRNGVIQRIHRARGGSSLCTAQFAAEHAVTFEKAEEIKKLLTDQSEHYQAYKKIYHIQLERVIKEFAKVIADYQKTNQLTISSVELTGGGSLFPNFTSHASDILQFPVQLVDPFSQVAYPAFMEDTLRVIGPTFTVALGAALRSFEY